MKPAKAHRKKPRARALEAEPELGLQGAAHPTPEALPSQTHHCSTMATKQRHSSAMETKHLNGNTMETKQVRSNTMGTKQLYSNVTETKRSHGNTMETKQLNSNTMETKQRHNTTETKQPDANTTDPKQLQTNVMETKQCHTNTTQPKQPNPNTMETQPVNGDMVTREPPRVAPKDTQRFAPADGECSSDEGGGFDDVPNLNNSHTPGNSPRHSGSAGEDSLSEYDNVGSEEEEEEPDYDEDEELRTDADGMTYYVHCCPEDESYMEGMDCHEGGDTGDGGGCQEVGGAGEGPSTSRGPNGTSGGGGTSQPAQTSEGFCPPPQQDPDPLAYQKPEPLTDPTFIQAPMAEDEEDEEEEVEEEEEEDEEEEEEDDYFPYEGEEAEEDQDGALCPRDRGERRDERGEAECCRGDREQGAGCSYRGEQSVSDDCRTYTHTHTPPCVEVPRYTHTHSHMPPCMDMTRYTHTHTPPCLDTPPCSSYTASEDEEEAQAPCSRSLREEQRGEQREREVERREREVDQGSSSRAQSVGEAEGRERGRDGRLHSDPRGVEGRRGSEDGRCHVERVSHGRAHDTQLGGECEVLECHAHTHADTHPYAGHADGWQGSGSRAHAGHTGSERRGWHAQGHEHRSEVTVDLADEVRRSLSMGRHMERSHDSRETPERPRSRSHPPRPVSLPLVLPGDQDLASANLRQDRRRSAHFPDHASPERPERRFTEHNPQPNRTERNHRPPQQAKKNASFPSFVDVPGPCEPEDLIDGIIFAANYLGSTQLLSDRNPSKSVRMLQAQEAVDQVKCSSEDNQSVIEVDLFISTKAIKVLNADTQEAIMDNALRTISYIADIGSVVVLMARRRMSHSASLDSTESLGGASSCKKQYRMVCYVFESEDAQLIAQSIGQAFSMAYQEFLRAHGINPKDLSQKEYSEIISTQEMYNDDLIHFSNSENCKELQVEKAKGEILGVVIVESGWGSILPTVILACMLNSGAAARSGKLSVGDQIMAVNDTSLVGLPLATCQNIIKGLKNQVQVKLSVVSCPPVTTVLIKRPDLQYQLGFSVQNGIICSLMRGGIAERGGVRVGHRIIEINGQSVVAMAHEKIVHALSVSVGEINMKTMPAVMFRLLTGQETPVYI
ncbi:hypothetical protein ACEWY4_010683 [Coilia grayii]|uniref:Amyloid-beta A4 precursor protein-binding family A member 3 n=1 Tax=Coilia grayii TaxID=363190 RepID=A0ABD1K2K7_9TELE